MGMVMSFVQVTPDELERAIEDPEFAEEVVDDGDRLQGDLDKAWDGIQFLLNAAGVGLDLRLGGEFIGEDGEYSGWDATLVAEAARILGATPFEQLAPHLDPAAMEKVYGSWGQEDDLDYLKGNYEVLVQFFQAAAAAGGAAIVAMG